MTNEQSFSRGERGRGTPAPPTNLRTLAVNATTTTITWDTAADAGSYEVWVNDLTQTSAEPQRISVTGSTCTITRLRPAHTYRIQVYGVNKEGEDTLLSATAVEQDTTMASVIGEDIIECPPPTDMASICPLTCSPVMVEAPNIVRWSPFATRDFHKIRIRARTGGPILAQTVLQRTQENGALCISNMTDLMCDNTQLAINPPNSGNCPAGSPALSFCGTFQHNGATVYYRIETDTDKCVVHVLQPAVLTDYIIEADGCLPPQER